MLAYLVYTYAYYLFGPPFNDLFLLHPAVFSSSLFALVLTVCALDVPGVAARFSPRTPRRWQQHLAASGSTPPSGSSPPESCRWEVHW
jgi:hypothetical protein